MFSGKKKREREGGRKIKAHHPRSPDRSIPDEDAEVRGKKQIQLEMQGEVGTARIRQAGCNAITGY